MRRADAGKAGEPDGACLAVVQAEPGGGGLEFRGALLVFTVAIVSTAAYFREAHLKSLADNKTEEARQSEARADQEAVRATRSHLSGHSVHNIALAYRYLREGAIDSAERILTAQCPPEYRQWEWTFLHNILYRGRSVDTPRHRQGRSRNFAGWKMDCPRGPSRAICGVWDNAASREVLRRKGARRRGNCGHRLQVQRF